MNDLIIKIEGKIDFSNFDEWKKSLISKIHSINGELVSDEDFVIASDQIKTLKKAEKMLKSSKELALKEVEDINKLFSSIDEIREEARAIRLSLEKQIKFRKNEIKEKIIDENIKKIEDFIKKQSDEFQIIDHFPFLNRERFLSTIKGKATTKTLNSSLENLVDRIKEEIVEKNSEVLENNREIEKLNKVEKLLFQDKESLINLPKEELKLTIKNRILKFSETQNREKINELKKLEVVELEENGKKENFRIIIELFSTQKEAIELARSIKEDYKNVENINSIKLKKSSK